MPDLLLEIGTEELPAGAIAGALRQLGDEVRARLAAVRLGPTSVNTWGTPRRLIALAGSVPIRQPDAERVVRGPSRAAAFDSEGRPTGAAIGFARKQGVPVESLEIVTSTDARGAVQEHVAARVLDSGKPVVEVAGEVLADSIRALSFPKTMRWGEGGARFARPIRWIVALLDREVVPMEAGGIRSGRESRGHRFLAPDPFEVSGADALLPLLKERFVEADPGERRRSIREQAERLAAEAGGRIPWDEGLLEENVWLVEWPTALLGVFEDAFLELPRPVLVTAMKKHQRFFPVESSSGALLPRFVAIRNGSLEHLETVREGCEWVLRARFADARYFYEHDRQVPLEQMAEQIGRLLFQEKLGTMLDKRRRLELLAAAFADPAQGEAGRTRAVRAARLCKADLVSQMVVELPALQGIIGREYALAAGEDPAVADAIAEHYQPRSAGDALPASPLGRLLAVLDRMDTLVGYVGLGILPSGSSDPYGLRRAAQGVVQILAGEPRMPSLLELEVAAASAYHEVNGLAFPRDPLCRDLAALFDQRLEAFLEERGIRYDLVAAALSGGPILSTVVHAIVRRAEALQVLSGRDSFVVTANAAGRVARILRSAEPEGDRPPMPGKEAIHGGALRSVERAVAVLEAQARQVNRAMLREPAEVALLEAADAAVSEVARRAAACDFEGVYDALQPLRDHVDRFFDDVIVMADDPALRRARLSLLRFVDVLYKTLADFTKIAV